MDLVQLRQFRQSLLQLRVQMQSHIRSPNEVDYWRNLWMMLVGVWRLLEQSHPFLASTVIDYNEADHFAQLLLEGKVAERDLMDAEEGNSWRAGFYLISAE